MYTSEVGAEQRHFVLAHVKLPPLLLHEWYDASEPHEADDSQQNGYPAQPMTYVRDHCGLQQDGRGWAHCSHPCYWTRISLACVGSLRNYGTCSSLISATDKV